MQHEDTRLFTAWYSWRKRNAAQMRSKMAGRQNSIKQHRLNFRKHNRSKYVMLNKIRLRWVKRRVQENVTRCYQSNIGEHRAVGVKTKGHEAADRTSPAGLPIDEFTQVQVWVLRRLLFVEDWSWLYWAPGWAEKKGYLRWLKKTSCEVYNEVYKSAAITKSNRTHFTLIKAATFKQEVLLLLMMLKLVIVIDIFFLIIFRSEKSITSKTNKLFWVLCRVKICQLLNAFDDKSLRLGKHCSNVAD